MAGSTEHTLESPSADNPLSDTTPTTPSPLRANFPLPQELKDHIYSYLLSADEVVAPPYSEQRRTSSDKYNRAGSHAHTYKFDTNIIGVNKAIAEEALEYLCKKNTFIVVSHNWPCLGEIKHLYDIPIVTENSRVVAKFHLHSLEAKVHRPTQTPDLCGTDSGSFLMLLRDLPAFCRMIQWLGHTSPLLGRIVGRIDGSESLQVARTDATSADMVTTELNIRPTAGALLNYDKQLALLKPFWKMVVPGQSVKIRGTALRVHESSIMDYMRMKMSTPVVWVQAMLWDIIDTGGKLKSAADALAEAGHYRHAAHRYLEICKVFGSRLDPGEAFFQSIVEVATSQSVRPVLFAAIQIIIDAAVNSCFFRVKMLETPDDLMWQPRTDILSIDNAMRLLSQTANLTGVYPTARNTMLAHNGFGNAVACYWLFSRFGPNMGIASFHLQVWKQTLLEPDAYIEYDVAFLKKVQDDFGLGKMTLYEVAKGLSPCHLPVRIAKSEIPSSVLASRPRPDELHGWLHIGEYRAAVKAGQKILPDNELGLPLWLDGKALPYGDE